MYVYLHDSDVFLPYTKNTTRLHFIPRLRLFV